MEKWTKQLEEAQYILIGLGKEWEQATASDYGNLAAVLNGKNYFIVTIQTDGKIFESSLERERITAPCGNQHWFQCEEACTKDIWEEGEVPDGHCPHCGKPLVPNTVGAKTYIEEGYLPSWKAYTLWLSRTLNRKLLILELGADFAFPNVIRWPFEKTALYNQKAVMVRVNDSFPQLSAELAERMAGEKKNSLVWIAERKEEKEHGSHSE